MHVTALAVNEHCQSRGTARAAWSTEDADMT